MAFNGASRKRNRGIYDADEDFLFSGREKRLDLNLPVVDSDELKPQFTCDLNEEPLPINFSHGDKTVDKIIDLCDAFFNSVEIIGFKLFNFFPEKREDFGIKNNRENHRENRAWSLDFGIKYTSDNSKKIDDIEEIRSLIERMRFPFVLPDLNVIPA